MPLRPIFSHNFKLGSERYEFVFKTELLTYNINGTTVKSGETVYGLIGIKSDSFDAIKIKLE